MGGRLMKGSGVMGRRRERYVGDRYAERGDLMGS